MRAEHRRLCGLFEEVVLPHLRSDDPNVQDWLQAMYDALYPLEEHVAEPQEWLGLAAEFRKHVKWLPGGRLKRGHLDFDPVFDNLSGAELAGLEHQENRRARAIILNFVRDYGDLEHINVGWINESLSCARRPERGRRDVYVVVMKRASEEREQVHMLRMQKWDMTFRLDHGKSPETAMFETEEYTEYTQDRYLGCRRLGMNLFGPVRIGKISELYQGTQKDVWARQSGLPTSSGPTCKGSPVTRSRRTIGAPPDMRNASLNYSVRLRRPISSSGAVTVR